MTGSSQGIFSDVIGPCSEIWRMNLRTFTGTSKKDFPGSLRGEIQGHVVWRNDNEGK